MPNKKIFISYATEDKHFAYWLDLKLRTLGYATWIDKDNLLGGESFVEGIDVAIKQEAHCLVAIISKNSINKSAPRRERTIAASIGKEKDKTFLIPILLDTFKTSELTWDISDLSHISFTHGWAEGLSRLNRKLESINTPKGQSSLPILTTEIETRYADDYEFNNAWSNLFRFTEISKTIWRIKTTTPFSSRDFPKYTPFWQINDREFLALDSTTLSELFSITNKCEIDINYEDEKNTEYNKIHKSLIHKLVGLHARKMGMYGKRDSKNEFYMPYGMTDKDKIYYKLEYKEKTTWVKHSGVRRFTKNEMFNYHLSFFYSTIINRDEAFLRITPNFVLTDLNDNPLDPSKILSRRKKLCKMMFNEEWLIRLIAISTHIFGNDAECTLFEAPSTCVKIESRPLKLALINQE